VYFDNYIIINDYGLEFDKNERIYGKLLKFNEHINGTGTVIVCAKSLSQVNDIYLRKYSQIFILDTDDETKEAVRRKFAFLVKKH